jgi:hypothetical protein
VNVLCSNCSTTVVAVESLIGKIVIDKFIAGQLIVAHLIANQHKLFFILIVMS